MAQGAVPGPLPVGFAGLGTMGGPIAARLLSAGVPLVVHNRDRAKADALVAAGASWAESPKALGRAVRGHLVFVMVTDVRAVRAITLGRQGLASGASSGTLVVNLSTIHPEESRAVAERLGARGIRYLEAPVSGSRDAAERGELLVFAGGAAEDLALARPCLERFSRRVELVGPVGSGASMKLVNNLVTVGTVALDAEAVALGEALGLARAQVVDLLLDGGGESRMLRAKRDALVRREYPVQFKLSLADKDLRLIDRAARAAGVRALLARETKRLADEAAGQGFAEQDVAAIYEAARRRRTGPDRSSSGAAPVAPP